MATQKTIQRQITQELLQAGRGLLSIKYPNDIEMYLIAFELTDSLGKTEQYFVFPIMPSQLQKVEQNRTNIKKSSSGTTVLMSQAFTPSEISLKGDFGRSFKFLANPKNGEFSFGVFSNRSKDSVSTKFPTFDGNVKSGYGCIKILQNMIQLSSKLDSRNKPRRLFMYNMALGESYMLAVNPGGLTISQTMETNMIWNYSLSAQIIANIEDLRTFDSNSHRKALTNTLGARSIQNGVNTCLLYTSDAADE